MTTYWILENGNRIQHCQDEYDAWRTIEVCEEIAPDSEFTLEEE